MPQLLLTPPHHEVLRYLHPRRRRYGRSGPSRAHRVRNLPNRFVPLASRTVDRNAHWRGPLSGCNAVAVACYAAAGFTFGTIAAPLAPPAIVGCNTALGTCSGACAIVALTPTP